MLNALRMLTLNVTNKAGCFRNLPYSLYGIRNLKFVIHNCAKRNQFVTCNS